MTKQDLIDLCNEKITELNEKLDREYVSYEFFNDFCRTYNFNSMKGLLKIPYGDFSAAYLSSRINGVECDDIIHDVLNFQNILDNYSADDLEHINDIMLAFVHTSKLDVMVDLFKDTNERRMRMKASEILDEDLAKVDEKKYVNMAHDVIFKLIETNSKDGYDFSSLIYYYKRSPMTISNVMTIVCLLKHIKEEDLDYTTPEFRDQFKVRDIISVCSYIGEVRRRLNEEKKKIDNGIIHELNIYKKFLKNMENAFNQEEIKNYEMIIHDIDDEEIKKEFLRLVYEHNKEKYDEIDIMHDELVRNSLVNYLKILKDNGIKKEEIDLNKVIRNSCEDVEKMIKILNSIVGDKKIIIKILEISDYDNVSYLSVLKSRNIIGSKMLINYPNIFDSNSIERKMLDISISIINKYKLDFNIFSKYPELLIENSNLDSNLKILKDYKLIDKLSDSRKVSFLKNDNLCELIDKIIELGYEDLLVSDISLLNESNWDRVYVLKSMGIKPMDRDSLIKILRDDKFFISDSRLKVYIEDTSSLYGDLDVKYEVDVKEVIKNHETSERAISFDDVVISKNRVLRSSTSINSIDELFRIIIDGSILNMEEVETIKNSLINKVKKYDK